MFYSSCTTSNYLFLTTYYLLITEHRVATFQPFIDAFINTEHLSTGQDSSCYHLGYVPLFSSLSRRLTLYVTKC